MCVGGLSNCFKTCHKLLPLNVHLIFGKGSGPHLAQNDVTGRGVCVSTCVCVSVSIETKLFLFGGGEGETPTNFSWFGRRTGKLTELFALLAFLTRGKPTWLTCPTPPHPLLKTNLYLISTKDSFSVELGRVQHISFDRLLQKL